MGKRIRLDKYLVDSMTGTRKEGKERIKKGQVSVNGETVRKNDSRVDPEKDMVIVNGQEIGYTSKEYIMLYKPAGVVSATEDKKEKTVLDLLERTTCRGLFPVGRLDKDTEGLLLITNDGRLAHDLLSPKKHVDKVYYAEVDGRVEEEDRQFFQEGIAIGENEITLPADLAIIEQGEISRVRITLREGKYHQIKRMFEALGKKVLYLKRISMGTLCLDETLPKGGSRHLTETEIEQLERRKREPQS